jgi:alkanesulfonate monooxygenase SsuD/methylene tetrahydromethanopterin reductase-like flavin-dependent oxidoreductase (luciferase family)
VQIDIALEPGRTPDEVAELGVLAERHGIATLWITHDPASWDVFLSLGVAAQRTRRIRLGVMAISPYEMHPLKLANSLLTLNEMSNGRASVLVGGGGAFLGSARFQPQRRVRAVSECIQILKGASATRPLTFEGECYTVRNYQPKWARSPKPRILAGANRPQMLRMAGRRADGFLMSDFLVSMCRPAIQIATESLRAHGRDPEHFEINNYWAFHVKEDRQSALNEARSRVVLRGMLGRTYISQFLSPADADFVVSQMPAFYKAYRAHSPVIEGVPDSILDKLVEGLTLTSDLAGLDAKVRELRAFESAGLTHLTLGLHDDPADAIRVIGERVIPALA